MEQKAALRDRWLCMRTRPTILGLMGVIAFVAVWMAALRSNHEFLATVVFAAGVCTLCTATLIARLTRLP
jgi:hypothetical protein